MFVKKSSSLEELTRQWRMLLRRFKGLLLGERTRPYHIRQGNNEYHTSQNTELEIDGHLESGSVERQSVQFQSKYDSSILSEGEQRRIGNTGRLQ